MIREGILLVLSGRAMLSSLMLRGETRDEAACFTESGSDSVGIRDSSFGSVYQSARFADAIVRVKGMGSSLRIPVDHLFRW